MPIGIASNTNSIYENVESILLGTNHPTKLNIEENRVI